jgi:hypothetical protein
MPQHFILQADHMQQIFHTHRPAAVYATPLPSHVSLVQFPSANAKAASVSNYLSGNSNNVASQSSPHRHPTSRSVLIPHMDDMEEEIMALGYEKAMVAGAMAGVTEHVFMFPVDTIKTRMQAVQQPGKTYEETR